MENLNINNNMNTGEAKFGYNISIITTLLAVITFGIAVCTPPLSGPFCKAGCFQYPYNDIINRFPRDYYWMYPAIILSFSYLLMMISIHHSVTNDKRLYSFSAIAFAIISTIILSVDYFIQVSFIQPALLAGESEGIAMLSQYNPHGIFIILEELGFITMNISFFCLVPVFSGTGKPEKNIRWTFISGFFLMLLSFFTVSLVLGVQREYVFEVIIISITWLELIVAGILLNRYFRKLNHALKSEPGNDEIENLHTKQ